LSYTGFGRRDLCARPGEAIMAEAEVEGAVASEETMFLFRRDPPVSSIARALLELGRGAGIALRPGARSACGRAHA
jgi:hypothetical protein